MEEFGQLLKFTEKFESFANLTDVNISQNTQRSIDMTQLDNITNLTRSSSNFSDGRTHFHDQKNSELCHTFATLSALRQAILKFLKNFTSEKVATIEQEIYNPNGVYSYKIFLANFVGNVNPRSYQDRVLKRIFKTKFAFFKTKFAFLKQNFKNGKNFNILKISLTSETFPKNS